MSMISEFVEKLIDRLEELKKAESDREDYSDNHDYYDDWEYAFEDGTSDGRHYAYVKSIKIIKELAEEYKDVPDTNVGKWIPVSEKLPDAETDVIVLAKIKFKDGDFRHIITTGFYEDGTVASELSHWDWDGFLDSEWNEEEGSYIIPEGWRENCYYNTDEVYINAIDDEVVAWQPLPPCWKGE